MHFTRYTDVKAFYRDTYNILMRHEAQNVIPLGNVIIGNRGEDKEGWRDPVNWFMGTVSDAGDIVLTAIMTPPHNLTLYATDNVFNAAALDCLLDELMGADIPFPGVMTEKSLAEQVAGRYAARTGAGYEVETNLRTYALTEVNPGVEIGTVRLARESDMAFLPYWSAGFQSECFNRPMAVPEDVEAFYSVIHRKNRYILENNGTPVSMAGITRELETVCTIAAVYTPPYFRKKGYACACVAAVSQIGLDKGYKKCVLYADLLNPVSNSIYMKMGYKPIGDSLALKWTR
ncbi:MAG: GNAT family N-acetyltransferase [Defluviitaleaceae bacterium]|nr:GNAT family N-acetyltransferase [Defluviitaleaceae bacterium]MCL2240091.1 GNAT family N-acetyltransferase [Defluviitaleaceae bacterium]